MNLAPLMKPASIAVVGASQRMTRATRVVANLQRGSAARSGIGAGMLMNAPFSSMAHASYNAQRAELIAAMQSGGLKAFLEARDGGFRPEPFGPRAAPKS